MNLAINPRSAARAAFYLARDVLGDIGAMAEALIPAQAVRCARGRDYDAAVERAAAPVDVEEFDRIAAKMAADPHGPGWRELAGVDDPYFPGAAGSLAGGSPPSGSGVVPAPSVSEDKRQGSSAGPHQDSASDGSADPSPVDPPAGGDDAAAPPSPLGLPRHTNSDLVDLIAEVLDAHEGHYNRVAANYGCLERKSDGGWRRVWLGDDYQAWLRHVAPLIAERIEKATPPVGFRLGGGNYA